MKRNLPELLCPAGNEEALHVAVDFGADAVYLGYRSFGARASAVNFDDEALEKAVHYAHLHHVRVHVTVNTLIKPDETKQVSEALRVIDTCGADAVIVQDLGVASMVRSLFPNLALHASTQMAVCNAEGVKAVHRLSFDRVVLARECSLDDIRKACETGIEIETFAHGALCTAVSGRCLMSSLSGGRSGNRGRCAQPCRQCFTLGEQEGALLSMRDLCLLDDLSALCNAGVASLKIEGRLKSPEYVAVVTDVYRHALDAIASGTPFDSTDARHRLLQIYNRGGFTRGHAFGAEDADLITPGKVNHEGLPIGRIISIGHDLARLSLSDDLHNGDTLQLRAGEEADVRYSGPEVSKGSIASLHLRQGLRVRSDTPVFRLSDAQQLARARAHQPKAIPVTMSGTFRLGQPMQLTMSDGTSTVHVFGDSVDAARSRASSPEDVAKQLCKLGETPFMFANPEHDLELSLDENVFLPNGSLNVLRRQAAKKLKEARVEAFRHHNSPDTFVLPTFHRPIYPVSESSLAVIFPDLSVAERLQCEGANLLIWSPRDLRADALERGLKQISCKLWLRLHPQMTQSAVDAILPLLNAYQSKLCGIVAESVSQLFLLPELPMIAGEGIPATNCEAISLLKQLGVSAVMPWTEWTASEKKKLCPIPLPSLLKMYGRETLMLLSHCPERTKQGLKHRHANCSICKSETAVCGRENAVMIDRKGYHFPLSRVRFREGCQLIVLGALPTDLRTYDADRKAFCSGILLHFTNETPDEQISILRAFAAMQRGERINPPPYSATSAHHVRGVE